MPTEPTEVMPPRDEFNPQEDQTLKVWQLQQFLMRFHPDRPVQVFACFNGTPLILDVLKLKNASGFIQIHAE